MCGICSAIALFVWLIIDAPTIAILLAVAGDGLAALPTIYKAWKYPETESGLVFLAGLISCLLIIPSIAEWNIQNSAFQVYLLIVDALLVFSIYRNRLFSKAKI